MNTSVKHVYTGNTRFWVSHFELPQFFLASDLPSLRQPIYPALSPRLNIGIILQSCLLCVAASVTVAIFSLYSRAFVFPFSASCNRIKLPRSRERLLQFPFCPKTYSLKLHQIGQKIKELSRLSLFSPSTIAVLHFS